MIDFTQNGYRKNDCRQNVMLPNSSVIIITTYNLTKTGKFQTWVLYYKKSRIRNGQKMDIFCDKLVSMPWKVTDNRKNTLPCSTL